MASGKDIPIPSTTAKDDLDELLGGPRPAAAPKPKPSASARKLNAYVDPEIQEQIKRAQFWTQTQPQGYRTFSDLVEDVLRMKAEELAALYNGGEPFPEIPDGKLRQGRPTGR